MTLTLAQHNMIEHLMRKTKYTAEEVWKQFFNELYSPGALLNISVNAASEIIQFLKREETIMAFMAKMMRTEEQQHEWEMYPDGKL